MTRAVVVTIFAVTAVATLAIVGIDSVVRPDTGPFALAATLEEHLLLIGIAAAVVAAGLALGWCTWGARLRLLAVVLVVVGIVRLGDEWYSATPAAATERGGQPLTVLSWNVEVGSKTGQEVADGIRPIDADVVALQELTTVVATVLDSDPELRARYPYRILEPREPAIGMGLLSRYPLVREGYLDLPPVLSAGLLLPDGRRIEVMDVHAYPPVITTVGPVPVALDTTTRDDHLAVIRGLADAAPDGRLVLIAGDLNASPFESGYRILASDGLADAHETAGTGPGFTWRPDPIGSLGLGMLRIDHVLTGATLRPTAVDENCSVRGDHCRLIVDLAVDAPKAGG
jgi:endonuclease/exonuclease/phosphatase (EEP) superfamily protein YafD